MKIMEFELLGENVRFSSKEECVKAILKAYPFAISSAECLRIIGMPKYSRIKKIISDRQNFSLSSISNASVLIASGGKRGGILDSGAVICSLSEEKYKLGTRALLEYPGFLAKNLKVGLQEQYAKVSGQFIVEFYLYKKGPSRPCEIPSSSNVSSVIQRLEKRGIVKKSGNKYELAEGVKKSWELLEESYRCWNDFENYRNAKGVGWRFCPADEFYNGLWKKIEGFKKGEGGTKGGREGQE